MDTRPTFVETMLQPMGDLLSRSLLLLSVGPCERAIGGPVTDGDEGKEGRNFRDSWSSSSSSPRLLAVVGGSTVADTRR